MKVNAKKIASCVCFIFLMLIDKVVGTESQYIWFITNNLVGIAFSIIIISSFDLRSFIKPFYLIWSFLGVIGVIIGYEYWLSHQIGHIMAFWITVPLNIWILGLIAFKYIERVLFSKDLKLHFDKWEFVFALCMILMVLSRNESIWPLYYLVIFMFLWHCPLSPEDKNSIFAGALDGVIIGFLVIQFYAFFATRYVTPRYYGAYGDCNRNACMYLMVLSAVFSKNIFKSLSDNEHIKSVRSVVMSIFLPGVVLAFILYTGCRSALVGGFFVVISYALMGLKHTLKYRWIRVAGNLVSLSFVVLISVTILYIPIRYLPEASRHVFSIVRGTEESFLENNSTYNYVSFDKSMESVFFRAFKSDISASDNQTSDAFSIKTIPHRSSSGKKYYTVYYSFREFPERGTFSFTVPASFYRGMRSLNIRINIYLVLLRNLNLTGHATLEMYIDIKSDVPGAEFVPLYNAQNFVVNFLYAYGMPIGILICILMMAELIWIIRIAMSRKIEGLFFLLIAISYICMGLMEVVWIPGQLVLILLFVAPFFLKVNCDGSRIENK